MSRDFIPYGTCTVASDDCFTQGRCLDRCRTRMSAADANTNLSEALSLMRKMREYITTCRSVTHYVDGSSIDITIKRANEMLASIGKHIA